MNQPARTVDATLFAPGEKLLLAGGRCPECATIVFPTQDGCPRCSHRPLTAVALPERGVVWSWTVQHFQPKSPFRVSPEGWSPLALGYVDLGDVIVEAWLLPADRQWKIGDEVSLTTAPAWTDADGVVSTFAFESTTGLSS